MTLPLCMCMGLSTWRGKRHTQMYYYACLEIFINPCCLQLINIDFSLDMYVNNSYVFTYRKHLQFFCISQADLRARIISSSGVLQALLTTQTSANTAVSQPLHFRVHVGRDCILGRESGDVWSESKLKIKTCISRIFIGKPDLHEVSFPRGYWGTGLPFGPLPG